MTLEQIYRSYSATTPEGNDARALLAQTHWYSALVKFDPRTSEALPQTLSDVLWKIANPISRIVYKDRLWRIAEHARPSLEILFRNLNESPRREHDILPLRAVRELDTPSFMALSRRPGRNIREKLAGKPYLQAVRRFQSVDLPENQLLKAFCERLAELLELRAERLDEQPDILLDQIRSWLATDEVHGIRRWENLPPNNTLLSHRNYRAVYDSWRWLQSLDDDIAKDLENLDERQKTMAQWQKYGKMYANKRHLFAEEPVFFDYEKFEIRPWTNKSFFVQARESFTRPLEPAQTSSPACIDLSELYPRYAYLTDQGVSRLQRLPKPFLWQRWENPAQETVEIELYNADAAYLHSDATTISAPALFFSRNYTPDHLDRAARAFAVKLRETFTNDTLFWLQPDYLNDFELAITRRNINACFPNAQPLPRSVAAVFENVDYNKLHNGYAVVVVDSVGGKQCAIKLEAKYDATLEKQVPETRGFYWERQPPVVLSNPDAEQQNDAEEPLQETLDMVTVDSSGQWHDAPAPKTVEYIDQDVLKHNKRIGLYKYLVNIWESPVRGVIKLHRLQEKAGDIPLWRDKIPVLSIQLKVFTRLNLVSRGTTIKPIRGQSVPIPVNKTFMLPAGRPHYQFSLFMGENEDEPGFSAKLESRAFPLKESLECSLNLTFTYGEDNAYNLVFEPCDHSIRPIPAQWEKTIEKIVTNAPAPAYPKPKTWEELRRFDKPDRNETSDLLDWVQNGLWNLRLKITPQKRTIGTVFCDWKQNIESGLHYTFIKCDRLLDHVYINENSFIAGHDYSNYNKGSRISFELCKKYKGGYFGQYVASAGYKEERNLRDYTAEVTDDIVSNIRGTLYFPMIQIWRDGRSIDDKECPFEFKKAMKEYLVYLRDLLHLDIPEEIKDEIWFLLSSMHKDAPNACIQWNIKQVNKKVRDFQAVGFALGDVSTQWQKNILDKLIGNLNEDSLRVFAYAIWREEHFVEKFTLSECQAILDKLKKMLAKIKSCPPRKDENDKWAISRWIRSTVEPLELLLGMLRTRNSPNEEIRMLLQPHQKITKELTKQVERIAKIVADLHVSLFSRVQLVQLPPKPEGDKTPDLLYALGLYLTNDDGANAIQITGVSDGDA